MRRVLSLSLATVAALAVATPASASLVWTSSVDVSGQGFGNVPRTLTVMANGSNKTNTESGCASVVATATISLGTGACLGSETNVHDGNTVISGGGDEPPPLDDNQKYGIPTVASLGWASAADISILFNATDPGGDGLNLSDLTLKFYSASGALIAAIDGSQIFSNTDVGNGGTGKVFTVSGGVGGEQDYLNNLIFNGSNGALTGIYISLEATIVDAEGGPESFTALGPNTPTGVPEPATWAMMLLGFGGVGMAMRRRRSKEGELLQIA